MSRDKQPGKPEFPDAATVVQRWAELWSAQDVSGADRVFASELHDHRAAPARDIEGIDAETPFSPRQWEL